MSYSKQKFNNKKLVFIQPPPFILGRDKEIDLLISGISNYSTILVAGIAGIGKTSLASIAANKIIEKGESQVIWVNCQRGFDINSLILSIIDHLYLLSPESFPNPDDFFNSLNYNLNDMVNNSIINIFSMDLLNNESIAMLFDFISVISDTNITFFVDEYEIIDKRSAGIFISLIKKYLRGARFVFMSREIPTINSEILLDILTIKLELLNETDCKELIKKYISEKSIKEVDENLIDKMVQYSSGHPFILKSFIGSLISGKINALDISKEMNIQSYINEKLLKKVNRTTLNVLNTLVVMRRPINLNELSALTGYDCLEPIMSEMVQKLIINCDLDGCYHIHNLLSTVIYDNIPNDIKIGIHKKCANYLIKKSDSESRSIISTKYKIEAFYHYFYSKERARFIDIFIEIIPFMKNRSLYKELESMISLINQLYVFNPPPFLEIYEKLKNNWIHYSSSISPFDLSLIPAICVGGLSTYNQFIQKSQFQILLLKAELLINQGNIEGCNEILKQMEEFKLPGQTAETYYLKSITSFLAGKCTISIKHSESALRAAISQKDSTLLVKIVRNLAQEYISAYRLKPANNLLEKYLPLFEDSEIRAEALLTIGEIRYRESNIEEAIQIANEALSLAEKSDNKLLTSKILIFIGILHSYSNTTKTSNKTSLHFLYKGLSLIKKMHNTLLEYNARLKIAYIFLSMEKYSDAEEIIKECASYYEQYGIKKRLIEAYRLLGYVYYLTNRIDEGISFFYAALALSKELLLTFEENTIRLDIISFSLETQLDRATEEISQIKPLNLIKGRCNYQLAFWYNYYQIEISYRKGRVDHLSSFIDEIRNQWKNLNLMYKICFKYLMASCGKKEWMGETLIKTKILEEINYLAEFKKFQVLRQIKRLDVLSELNRSFIIITNDETIEVETDEIEEFRKNRENFDLFFDSIKNDLFEKKKGMIDFSQKRTLSLLLKYIITNTTFIISEKDIYEEVWGGEYDKRLNYNTVRVSLYRLKSIIEPSNENDKYIKSIKLLGKNKKRWFFDRENSFCFIGKKD